jgi:hypothetical protein
MASDYDAADIASLARDLIVAGRSESQAWAVAESFVAERNRRQEVVREQENEAKRQHEFERRVRTRAEAILIKRANAGDISPLEVQRKIYDSALDKAREQLRREGKYQEAANGR